MEKVAQVRSFNRFITERVGALQDQYLGRGRPLGESRLLWEIGPNGCDVRDLRARLGLDSGYVSRMLRSLEDAGLARVEPGVADRRVRTARLTQSGRREWKLLDAGSNRLAASFLEPLNPKRRERLVAAMVEVELLLTAGLVEFTVVDPESPAATRCLAAYFAELNARFDTGFDPALSVAPDVADFRPPSGQFILASLRGEPVACGALRLHRASDKCSGWAEIKRMWVAGTARGLGLGRRLLTELEIRAAGHGARLVRLETNKTLAEAISLYRSSGYREIAPFNDERYGDHWFEKQL